MKEYTPANLTPDSAGLERRFRLNFVALFTSILATHALKASRLSQKIHKWLGLLVGLQLLIWTFSGFYMVVVDIDIIHGDHLVTQSGELSEKTVDRFSSSLSQLWELHQGAQAIALKPIGGRSVIQITYPDNTILLDAQNGESLAPLDELAANRLAMSYYAGSGEIRKSSLIETNPPREIGARTLPLWRIDFGDVWGTTLYISPTTGELATRRHTLWRIFDFVWMLHIMDYDEREDINNMLLRLVSFFAFLLVCSGVWYLYFRLNMKSWFAKVNS